MPGGMIRTCQHVPSIPSCPFSIVIPCQARASHQKLTDGSLTLGPAGPKRPIRTGQRISSCHPDLKSARWHLIGAPSGNAALGAQEKKCRSFRKYSRCYSWQDEYLTGGAEYSQYGQHSRDSPHRKIGQAGKYKTYGWYKEGKKYSHGVSVQCSSKFDDQSKGPDDHRTQTGRAWADRKRDRAAQKNERGQQAELAEGWQARKKRKVWESNEKGAVSPGTAEARGESCPQMSGSTKEGLAEGLAETGTIASDLPGSGGHVGRAGSSSASQSDHAPVGKGSENAQGEMAAALVTPPVGSTRPPPLTGRMGSTERRGAALEGVRFLRSVEREGDEWAEREEDDPTWGGWGGRGASEEHFPAGSNGGGADWEVGASGVKSAGGIAAGGRESAYQRKEEEEEEADGEDRWQGVAEGGAGGAGEGEGGSATSAKMTCQHEGDSLQSSASSSGEDVRGFKRLADGSVWRGGWVDGRNLTGEGRAAGSSQSRQKGEGHLAGRWQEESWGRGQGEGGGDLTEDGSASRGSALSPLEVSPLRSEPSPRRGGSSPGGPLQASQVAASPRVPPAGIQRHLWDKAAVSSSHVAGTGGGHTRAHAGWTGPGQEGPGGEGGPPGSTAGHRRPRDVGRAGPHAGGVQLSLGDGYSQQQQQQLQLEEAMKAYLEEVEPWGGGGASALPPPPPLPPPPLLPPPPPPPPPPKSSENLSDATGGCQPEVGGGPADVAELGGGGHEEMAHCGGGGGSSIGGQQAAAAPTATSGGGHGSEDRCQRPLSGKDRKRLVADLVAQLLAPLYRAGRVTREEYKSIMRKSTEKVMERDAEREAFFSADEFLNPKRRSKIRSLVDKYIAKIGTPA